MTKPYRRPRLPGLQHPPDPLRTRRTRFKPQPQPRAPNPPRAKHLRLDAPALGRAQRAPPPRAGPHRVPAHALKRHHTERTVRRPGRRPARHQERRGPDAARRGRARRLGGRRALDRRRHEPAPRGRLCVHACRRQRASRRAGGRRRGRRASRGRERHRGGDRGRRRWDRKTEPLRQGAATTVRDREFCSSHWHDPPRRGFVTPSTVAGSVLFYTLSISISV